VTVEASDGDRATSKAFSVSVVDVNEAPSSLALSSSSVIENSPGASVGTLSASDAEDQAISYTITDADDGALFEIDGSNQLKLKSPVSADFETKPTYSVTVEASDGELTASDVFSISVGDVNEAPTLTVPTDGSVTEDAVASTITGSLIGSDPENNTLTYLMADKTVADDSYTVDGTYGTLQLNTSNGTYTYALNNSAVTVDALPTGSSVTETFSVQVTDGSNTTTAQNLSFSIQGANDAPTIVTSTSITVSEDTATAPILFSGTDVDTDGSLFYNFGEPTKGTVTDNNNGTFTYAPNLNENGNDSFTISVSDGAVTTTEVVQLEILPINDDVFFVDYFNRVYTKQKIETLQTDVDTIEMPKLSFNFENLQIGLNGDKTFNTPGLIFETNKLSIDFGTTITSNILITLIEDLGVEGSSPNLREGEEREITLSFNTETSLSSDNMISIDNSPNLSVSYKNSLLSSKLNLQNRQHETFNYFEDDQGNNYYEIKIFDVINSFGETIRPLLPLYENATYYYEVNGVPLISNDLDTATILTGQFDLV